MNGHDAKDKESTNLAFREVVGGGGALDYVWLLGGCAIKFLHPLHISYPFTILLWFSLFGKIRLDWMAGRPSLFMSHH